MYISGAYFSNSCVIRMDFVSILSLMPCWKDGKF